ncbi:MAG TPA: anthranilate phosphoribosyltransferase [Gemmatimonadaceae bacterium]|nr:anthranilate phosphoribosyltransferase [Gemmatimonadaceae bacterium]
MSSKPADNALVASIRRLALGEELPAPELTRAFDLVMAGEGSPAQVAALLMGLRVKGETPGELAAAVRALRHAMIVLPADRPDELVDTCGTGGGRVQTFNISTAAALLAAGAGVRIAKHGNRSFTTQCGSADVLEALAVNIDVPAEVMARALRDAGIVFMFAPLMHPAMRHVGPVRRELAISTLMNIVGPLANPALAGRQVVGVGDESRVPLIAGALAELDTVHTLVVHGAGMDEISPLGETRVIELRDSRMAEWTIVPGRYDFGPVSPDQLAGGSPRENAAAVLRVLSGQAAPGAAAAVVLNAAAAIYVSGRVKSFDDGVDAARAALANGLGLAALERLRRAYALADSAEAQ